MSGGWTGPGEWPDSSIGPDGQPGGVSHPQYGRMQPRGRPGGSSEGGPAAARQARPGPHRARPAPRSHGRPAEAPRVPGRRAHRRAHRRRLHGARRRSLRPCGDASGALARADRRQRAHLPGAGREDPGHRRAPGAALQLGVARHADRGPLPSRAQRHGGAAARARRPRQAHCGRNVGVARLRGPTASPRRRAAAEPISLLELLYPVLQGYDSVAVAADVELGGTDQTFNLFMGRAIQSAYGQTPRVILTTPLINGTDGARKMSKSYGNHVGITDPPEEMYGRILSIPDALLGEWYDVLLGEAPPERVGPRDAKRGLARSLGDRFHGPGAGEGAEAHFDRVFVEHAVPEDVEEATFAPADGTVHLAALIGAGFGGS